MKRTRAFVRLYLLEAISAIFDFLVSMLARKKKPLYSHESSQADNVVEVIWIGHATVLLNMFGKHILTDPVFSDRALTVKRKIAPSLRIKQLPQIDIVVISHSHFDHLDNASLLKLDRRMDNCTFVVPVGYSKYLRWMRNRVVEMPTNEKLHIKDVIIRTHEPEHWTNRFPWQHFEHLNTYTFEYKGKKVFFAGDTAYIKELHKRLPKNIDIALLPIGAYFPQILETVHMTPEQALQLADEMQVKHVIPMHYETFRLSFEDMDEPRRRFIDASAKHSDLQTYPVQIGQKVTFDNAKIGRIEQP